MGEICKQTGKTMFTKNSAEKFIKNPKLAKLTKKKLRAYYCKFCHFLHLTSVK